MKRQLRMILAVAAGLAIVLLLIGWRLVPSGGAAFFLGLVSGVMLAVVAVLVLVVLAQRRATDLRREMLADALPDAPARGDSVLAGWSVETLDGRAVPMTEYSGKVLFLNFWAIDCPPCVAELPSIERLKSSVSSEGVEFLCVSKDEDHAYLKSWLESNGLALPVVRFTDQPPQTVHGVAIPTTCIIASDGRIALRHDGGARWDTPRVIAFLRTLIDESSLRDELAGQPDVVSS